MSQSIFAESQTPQLQPSSASGCGPAKTCYLRAESSVCDGNTSHSCYCRNLSSSSPSPAICDVEKLATPIVKLDQLVDPSTLPQRQAKAADDSSSSSSSTTLRQRPVRNRRTESGSLKIELNTSSEWMEESEGKAPSAAATAAVSSPLVLPSSASSTAVAAAPSIPPPVDSPSSVPSSSSNTPATSAVAPIKKDVNKTFFSWDEIKKHTTVESCWLVVRNEVFDVTPFLEHHPAGVKAIVKNSGMDATESFDFHSTAAQKLWKTYKIGRVEGTKDSICVIS